MIQDRTAFDMPWLCLGSNHIEIFYFFWLTNIIERNLSYSVCVGDSTVEHSLRKFHVKHRLVRILCQIPILSQLPIIPHCDADLDLLVGTSDFDWFGKPEINKSTYNVHPTYIYSAKKFYLRTVQSMTRDLLYLFMPCTEKSANPISNWECSDN